MSLDIRSTHALYQKRPYIYVFRSSRKAKRKNAAKYLETYGVQSKTGSAVQQHLVHLCCAIDELLVLGSVHQGLYRLVPVHQHHSTTVTV